MRAMSRLHDTIDGLAFEFAHRVLRAVRDASLEEIASGRVAPEPVEKPKKGKRVRRSPEELGRLADKIVSLVSRHPKGILAEKLKRAMGVPAGNVGAKAFTKPLSFALASKRIKKLGARRQTIYVAA